MDGFFDAPNGYSDADLEMASLEERGNRWAKLVRRYGEEKVRALQAGEVISHGCVSKSSGEPYTVMIRMWDLWDLGYSMTGEKPWAGSAAEAFAGGVRS